MHSLREASIGIFLLLAGSVTPHIVVIGGVNDVNGRLNDVEVLDMEGDGSGSCDRLPDYPVEMFGATGAFLPGEGVIKVCGGYGGGLRFLDLCYDYDPVVGGWLEAEPMIGRRGFSSSSVIGEEWFVTGGDDPTPINSTEKWDGTSFNRGPDLLVPMVAHCQVTLNDTHVFLSDVYNSLNTYIMNYKEDTFQRVGSPSQRYDAGPCGMATTKSKGQEIVVVADSMSEIFSVENMSWRKGPTQDTPTDWSASAQVDNTFVVIGGVQGEDNYLDIVVRYEPESETWEELDITLDIPRRQTVAVTVPDGLLGCEG